MSADPTLLFVVGAAKAGTSWLYRYLHGHPDCHFRSIKELHFFDNVVTGAVGPVRDRLTEKRTYLEAKFVEASSDKLATIGSEIADIDAWLEVLNYEGDRTEAYLSYLHGGRETEKVIGDITPSYALLPAEELQTMARLCPDTRFIYIMRDPVERLWSHVRMEVARRNPHADVDERTARPIFFGVLNGREPEIAARGDYGAAVEKLKDSVDPARVLLAFTEEMFSASGIRKICDFLGIGYVAPETELRIHQGIDLKMRVRQRRAAREYLAPQYDYIEQLFGRLPTTWQPAFAEV